ncbi:YbaB/EbfC family nucleoid-associated protein [Glycomyces tarimensis]
MSDRDPRPDPEAMLAKLEAMQRDAEQTLRKYEEMRAELDANAVEAFSEDGLVRVKLDADGRVAEIGIDEMAMRRHQTLSGTIRSTVDEALAGYAIQSAEMAQQFVGDKFDFSAMLDSYMPPQMRDRARRNLDQR